jgi:hypothetical protein
MRSYKEKWLRRGEETGKYLFAKGLEDEVYEVYLEINPLRYRSHPKFDACIHLVGKKWRMRLSVEGNYCGKIEKVSERFLKGLAKEVELGHMRKLQLTYKKEIGKSEKLLQLGRLQKGEDNVS